MSDHWDTLFDELYLTTYAETLGERDSAAEALAAMRLIGLEPSSRVLDVPCGFGRHSIPLAESGYEVVGVDRSAAQLAEAKRRSGGAANPEFVQADFRELPFEDAGFDGAICLFTSVGYRGEEGDRRMLREIRRVLKPRASLVVETMHRDRLAKIFQARTWDPLPDGGVVLEEREFDQVAGVIRVIHTLITGGGERRSVPYEVRTYTATELARLLEEAGFSETKCFGDLEGDALAAETRLVVVSRIP